MDQPSSQRSTRSMVSSQTTEDSISPGAKEPNLTPARSSNSNSQSLKKLNYDFNLLLKLMNKRKLHLPCPQCKALVVNLTDHLTKTHFVKNINERRNLIDSVRNEFILNEEGVHKLLEFNKDLKLVIFPKSNESFEQDLNSSTFEETKEDISFAVEEENDLSANEYENSDSSRSFKKRKLSKPVKKPYVEVEDLDGSDIVERSSVMDGDENKDVFKKMTNIESQLSQFLTKFNTFVNDVNIKINKLNDQLKNTSDDLNLIKGKLFKE